MKPVEFQSEEEFQEAFNQWKNKLSKAAFYRKIRGKAFRKANAFLRNKYPIEYQALLHRFISELLEEERKRRNNGRS